MAQADHVRVRLFWKNVMPYWHHGIDMGDGTVIHFTSGLPLSDEPSSSTNALISDRERLEAMEIRRTSIQEFSGGKRISVVEHNNALPHDEVLKRAEDAIGERAYLLSQNNCEHFAHWCKTGRARSWQVEGVVGLAHSTTSATAKGVLALAAKRKLTETALKVASAPLAGAAKAIKPIFLLADVAEYASFMVAQRMGCDEAAAKSVGRWTGRTTAATIGMVSGGPAGAAAAVTVHEVTGKIAETLCRSVTSQTESATPA